MKRLTLSVLLVLTLSFTLPAQAQQAKPQQPDTAIPSQQEVELRVRIGLLEAELANLKAAKNESYQELEKRFEVQKENLDFKMGVVGWLIALFGLFITCISLFFGWRMYSKVKEDAKEARKEIEDIAEDTRKKVKVINEDAQCSIDKLKEMLDEGNKLFCDLQKHEEDARQTIKDIHKLSDNTVDQKVRSRDEQEKAKAIAQDKNASAFERDWASTLVYYIDKKYDKALKKYRSLLKNYPSKINFDDLAYIYNNMGVCYTSIPNYDDALTYFNSAIALNPIHAAPWNNKGYALFVLGKREEAILCYESAVQIAPKDARIWNNKGKALAKMKKYEEALACFNKTLELNPEHKLAKINSERMLKKIEDGVEE